MPVKQTSDGAMREIMAFPGQFLPDLLEGDALVLVIQPMIRAA